MVKRKSIELYIEELDLQGFAAADRVLIATYIQQQMEQLLATQGIPDLLNKQGDIPLLKMENFGVAPKSNAATIGKQVAESLYNGFNGTSNNK